MDQFIELVAHKGKITTPLENGPINLTLCTLQVAQAPDNFMLAYA